MTLRDQPSTVRAFAPGGIGNIGPGLDILGCAVTGPGDAVTARRTESAGVRIEDPGHADLPRTADRHASGIAAAAVLRAAGAENVGVALRVEKGLPLAGGQAGSAASAVAAAVATNALLGGPLDRRALLRAALESEERLAGRHVDNLASSLLGGIVLVRSVDALDVVRLPVPRGLCVVLVHPDMRLSTARARAVLPDSVPLSVAIAQAGAVAVVVAAFTTGDLSFLRGVEDGIAEPARAPLLPGFAEAKRAALAAGALTCSISGAGPSAFALVENESEAQRICDAMVAAYVSAGLAAAGRVARIDERGARVEPPLPPTR